MHTRFLFVTLFALLVTACNPVEVGVETPTNGTAVRLSETPSVSPPTVTPLSGSPTAATTPTEVASADWVTYTNEPFAFSLQHPANLPITLLSEDAPFGYIGDTISFQVSDFDPLECRGDCPVVNGTERDVVIGNLTATRIRGYYGAIGGNIPHEYLAYLYQRDGQFYTFTLHAVGRSAVSDQTDIVPLPVEAVPLFEQILGTLQFAPAGLPGFRCEVAYTDTVRLICLDAAGNPQTISDAPKGITFSSPVVSADGEWVAYLINIPNEHSELWVASVSGAPQRIAEFQLVTRAQIPNTDPNNTNSPRSFQWLGSTHTLVFDTRFEPAGGIQGPGEYINNDLWRVDVQPDGQASQPLNLVSAQAGGNFHLSPDGQRIAVSGAMSIQLMNSDGSNRRNVIEYPAILTYSEYQYKPAAVWSTDSSMFYVVLPSTDPLAADSKGTFYRIGLDGAAQVLAELPGNFVFGGALPAGFAPNGARVVYGQSNAQGAIDLILINADGSNPTVFASNSLSANGWGWSPDSEWYAYGIVPEGGNFLLRQNGALQEFGAGLTIVGLEWVDATGFYFIAVSGNANYGLYFQRIGEPTQVLVSGLNPGLSFDAR